MKRIGRIIRWHRKKSGLTQKELADLAGVGKTVIFDIEHGKETVQFNSLLNVCNILNLTITLDSPLIDQCLKEIEK